MSFGFRKSINIGKGVKINLGKKGIGVSAGVKGFRVGVNSKGIRRTTSIPGTGIYSTKQTSWNSLKSGKDSSNISKEYYTLPDGVEVPKTPKKIIYTFLTGVILALLSSIFILLLPVSFLTMLTALLMMVFNKEFKSAYYTQRSIMFYKRGQFEKSYKYCNKALKNKENKSALILKESIEASN